MKQLIHKAKNIFSGYYYFLLICLILLFIFKPFVNNIIYISAWKLLFSVMVLSSIFNVDHNPFVRIVAYILVLPTILFCFLDLIYPCPLFFILNVLSTTIFLFACTSSILFDVVLRAKVTLETLRGVICAYFMIAFAFGYTFYLVEYLVPGSFRMIGAALSPYDYAHYLSQLFYFSFITLLTIGFGDITPLRSLSQTLTVIEGIIGQFYIAILVARLVSVYSVYRDDHAFSRTKGLKKPTSKESSPI